ncbi:MAG: phospholipase D-like domain-containing protein, partial [Nocardioides sp.]
MNDIATLVSAGAFVVVIDLAIRLLALVIIPRDRLPTAAMAWLLAVFFIPVIGVLLFLLIGNPKLPEKRQLKQREMDAVIARESRTLTAPSAPQEWPVWLEPVVTLTQTLTQMPLVGGNSALLLDDYEGSLAAMATEIDAATSYVHVEFYIFSLDATTAPFFESLEAAVRRGVTVRVLLDHWASSHCAGYKETLDRLETIGVEWRLMLPVQPLKGKYQRLDLRNHRKLLVVDGRVAFVGSQNLIDRSYNKKKNIKRGLKWQELMCRLEGPVAASIDMVFAT